MQGARGTAVACGGSSYCWHGPSLRVRQKRREDLLCAVVALGMQQVQVRVGAVLQAAAMAGGWMTGAPAGCLLVSGRAAGAQAPQ